MINPELLTAEQEVALGRRVRAWLDDGGDEADGIAARNELVERNLALIPFVCSRYFRNDPRRWDEANQDGAIGLMRAAEKFDPDKGYRFSTYASFWVRQMIYRGLISDRAVRVPLRYLDGHREKYEGSPEMADARRAFSVASLTRHFETGWDNPMPEREDDMSDAAADAVKVLIAESGLTGCQLECLTAFYGLGREPENQTEIAERMGYADRRGPASLRKSAVGKLRKTVRADPGLRDMVRFVLGKVAI